MSFLIFLYISHDFSRFCLEIATLQVEEEVIPVHPSVLIAQRSRFLADLFGPDLAAGGAAAVPVRPPHPELFLRALHAITTRARPELAEVDRWMMWRILKIS